MAAVDSPELRNSQHTSSPAAFAHQHDIDLGDACEVPYICPCCMGLPELLPDPMKGIDTSKNYIGVLRVQRPEVEVIRAGSLHLAHWFCNDTADCDRNPDWAKRFEDVKIWNWGNPAEISTTGGNAWSTEGTAHQAGVPPSAPGPAINRLTPRSVSLGPDCPWGLPIHESLLTALSFALFNDRFGALDFRSSESTLFNLLDQIANEYMRHIILRLREERLFKTGRPISHVFLDIIACVKSLKALAKRDGPSDEGNERRLFCTVRKEFWTVKLEEANIGWDSENANWATFEGRVTEQNILIYREVRNLLLLDPETNFKIPMPKFLGEGMPLKSVWSQLRKLRKLVPSNGLDPAATAHRNTSTTVLQSDTDLVPFFRAWRGGQSRRQNNFIRSTISHNFRNNLLTSAGIKQGEVVKDKEKPKANLADFRDDFIIQGAFKMELTNDPSLHLRFDETDFKRPTLLILDSRTLLLVALLDLTGLMSAIELDTFLEELLLSHSLFFGRSNNLNNSRPPQLAGIEISLIEDYQKYWSEDIFAVQVSDFPIYGSRLQTIHQRMTEWRSLQVSHAWSHRPYRDSLPFYAFRFALFFGILTALNFVLAIVGMSLNIFWHVHNGTNTSPAGNLTFLYQGRLGAEH